MEIDELITSDPTDDNRYAKALTEIKTRIDTYDAKINELEKALTDKETAITSLKASNFDLLNKVGKPKENDDTLPLKTVEEILMKGLEENE